MCPSSSCALGLGASVVNCSTMRLRLLTPVRHSQLFHHFESSNPSQFPQLGFDHPIRRVVEFRSKWHPRWRVLCKANSNSNKKRELSLERSEQANEELLMFFFHIDLTSRLQRALNQDFYEAAQGLREKIAEVEREMTRQRREKTGSGGASSVQDTAITLLQTKAKLQKLIAEEDYEAAGAVRKKIMALEADSLAAQANTMIYQQRSFGFRLGQKVVHRVHGYRGVVCGMDALCCESEGWAKAAGVEKLARARNQPFYQVLVDVREEPSVMVTYVAEDNLAAPEEPDFEQFDHPYVYFLFYGMDGAGDFIACKQLREKYDAPRHEIPHDKEGD